LAENSKGVKNIIHKVIKRLEGLGHLEIIDMDISLLEEVKQVDDDVKDREAEKVLYALGKKAITNGQLSLMMNRNGHADL
jgi:diacylglycerol kinase (CTP)